MIGQTRIAWFGPEPGKSRRAALYAKMPDLPYTFDRYQHELDAQIRLTLKIARARGLVGHQNKSADSC